MNYDGIWKASLLSKIVHVFPIANGLWIIMNSSAQMSTSESSEDSSEGEMVNAKFIIYPGMYSFHLSHAFQWALRLYLVMSGYDFEQAVLNVYEILIQTLLQRAGRQHDIL